MKLYAVEITYTAIVRAESEAMAEILAEGELRDIASDSIDPDVHVVREITNLDQLDFFGWDGMCLPYGETDGNTRLNEYLKS